VIFLHKYHQNPQERDHKKKRKCIDKREKEKKEEEKKASRVSSNKGEVNILKGKKHFNLKIFFLI
jgi:hypothetical protein